MHGRQSEEPLRPKRPVDIRSAELPGYIDVLRSYAATASVSSRRMTLSKLEPQGLSSLVFPPGFGSPTHMPDGASHGRWSYSWVP